MGLLYFVFNFFTYFLSFHFIFFYFIFYSLSLLDFSFRWDFVLVRVKQAVEFYKVFVIKRRGRELYSGGGNYEKLIIVIGQAGFTTSPGRSDTGLAVNYDWAITRMI